MGITKVNRILVRISKNVARMQEANPGRTKLNFLQCYRDARCACCELLTSVKEIALATLG